MGTSNADIIDYYRLEVIPYADIQLLINQIATVEKLFSNNLALEISNFRLNYFFSIILNDKKQYCLGMGYEN